MKKTLLAIALLCSAGYTHATEEIQWNQAAIGFASVETDGYKLNGLTFSGSKLLNDKIFIKSRLELSSTNTEISNVDVRLELSRFQVGVGYRKPIDEKTDFFSVASYQNYVTSASASISSGTFSVSSGNRAIGIDVGIRSLISDHIELAAALNYIRFDEEVLEGSASTDVGINLSANYHFNEKYATDVVYSNVSDVKLVEIKGTMFF